MSTVTQRIPNLLLGISQQPDNRKFPGQVREAVNTFPDYALGLLKRPGGQFETKLKNADTTGHWFPIIRDENEKYLCQIRLDGNIRIWNMLNGDEVLVERLLGADIPPAGCNISTLETNLDSLNTARADTIAKLALLHTAQADYAEVLAGQNETEQALFEVQYDYDKPGEIEQTVRSGILLNASGVYIVKNNNTIVSSATTLPADYALGTEFTNEYPLIASQGYRVYQAIQTVAATHDATDLSNAETAMNTAQTDYDNAVSAEDTAQSTYESSLSPCTYTTWQGTSGIYLNGATADDIKTLTVNDYTFILNTAKTVAYTSEQTAAAPAEAFFLLKVVGTGHYIIELDGAEVASYNSGSGGDADAILDNLVSDINGYSSVNYIATRIGDGIHIVKPGGTEPLSIKATGAPGSGSVFAFSDTVPNISSLPLQCHNGYKVKVVNTEDVAADDFYVEFEGTNGDDGSGTWVETNGFEVNFRLDKDTLPYVLVRAPSGNFVLTEAQNIYSYEGITFNAWAQRTVGDETTNPTPSFVGSTINNMFFYRNRLGFLTDENVVLSKSGDFFNFFGSSALTVADDDPIDISASTTKVVKLRYVRPSSVGLVLFSDREQFILNTDSDILSPKTAKINALSSYECDSTVEAVELGTSLAFLSKTPLYSKVYEIGNISTTNPPVMVEPTQYVPELVPSSVDTFISSPSMSLISLGTEGGSTLYQLRYAQQGDQRTATTWYKWELTGNLMLQFFDNSEYNAVVSNGSEVYLQTYDLSQDSEQGYLTLPTGERTDVCLDLWNVNPYRTYNDANDTTRVFLPYENVSGKTFAVVVLGGYIDDDIDVTSASVGSVLYPTVTAASGSDYVDLDGDYRGRNLIIGYIYNMEVELPKFFVTQSDGRTAQSDFTSDLIIHRIKVSTGLSGPVKYQIGITGRPEWNQTIEAVQPDLYELNNVNLTAESVQNIPIYQRNDNLSITVVGDTPMPVTLLNLTWEGRYNTGFYRRS